MDFQDDSTIKVKSQCEDDWKRLNAVQAELQNRCAVPVTPVIGEGGDQQSLHILHEQEKWLKAELKCLQEQELKTLSENKAMQILLLQQDQAKRVVQLKETLTALRGKREELCDGLKQEEETCLQLTSMNDVLKTKVAAASHQESTKEQGKELEATLAEMSLKVNKMTEAGKFYKQILKDFLTKHFPVQLSTMDKAALEDTRSTETDNFLPLRTIFGKLIEQSLNNPHQPYIDITEQFWPRHVEFLLRCQIVEKDPENSHRMKLVPFHL